MFCNSHMIIQHKLSHDGEYEELVVTEDSKIVLNQLRVSEQGLYRCLLQDQKGTTLSRIYFNLTGEKYGSIKWIV